MAVYRSAMGKNIDMTSFAAQNDKVRAVGNMNVNARGDILDSNNRIIKDGTKRVKNTYQQTVAPQQPEQRAVPKRTELTPEEQMFEDNDEDFVKDQNDLNNTVDSSKIKP